jgi:hypothetical protein
MKALFLILSATLPIISPVIYIRSILAGQSRPHRTTRFVYLATGILTTLALLSQHNWPVFAISAVSLVQSFAVFLFSFRYGMGGWAKSDIVCLLLSLIGMTFWQLTANSYYGLFFGIAADFAGSVPTIIKTYRYPQTEIPLYYAIDAMAGVLNIAALPIVNSQTVVYPVYLVLINGLIALLAAKNR